MGCHGLAEHAGAQNFHGGAAAGEDHALVADLGDEMRPRGDGFFHHHEFLQLMDEGLLAVDVFVVSQRGEHDRRVAVVRGGDDDGVELVAVFRKRLAVVGAGEGSGMLGCRFGEGVGIHVTEAGDFHRRMRGDLVAVLRADGPDDADAEHAEF